MKFGCTLYTRTSGNQAMIYPMGGTGAQLHILQHNLEDIKTFDPKSMLIFS